ncbi:sigma-54-dependent Fis family transcriptional regulator [Brevibacillus fulvus]|uniref:Transcriptional regulator of acetoin/glycerol metabolism n=1 Tax=Brevibacillus fulvus TaxID=1125967 RepID=A0A938Y0J5_9BACL|nr:sigma-54-dependent Fis family transcriptional regulator [Brevibacillus fulvus]MBM7591131.1 transcriptional regulator of acetoin/glycerol metabolism [Brevibacillus fulvus]
MLNETLSASMWKRFVQEGVLDSTRMNKRISESWIRCKQAVVNPYSGTGRSVLSGKAFDSQKQKSRQWLELTLPHVRKLTSFIEDTGMLALLIDPEGYVLSMNGQSPVLQRAREINFVEGVRWTEEEVGTNAIGTALYAGEPVMVIGTEHYSVASHHWSCSASPIRDEQGQLLGIVDLSCPIERTHPYMLAIVSTLAYTVEQEWKRRRQQDELELIRTAWEQLETVFPGVIVNERQQIVLANKAVREKTAPSSGRWTYPDFLREYGYAERQRTPVYSRQHGGLLGYAIMLSEPSRRSLLPASFSAQPIRFGGETGVSSVFRQVLQQIERISRRSINVFLKGESGTGKELVARAIHDNSPCNNGPFIAVNCGAIPKELIESELFGYAEGAFTGARRHGYKGKLVQANGGTLFLDEIGEIPPQMQVALLRVLQERKVTPIGSSAEIPVQLRIISATHRDMSQMVKEGTFREDLFYRLHVYPLSIPPLRERKEDIPHLVRYYCQKNNLDVPMFPELIDQFMHYDWPGNVRELFNVLERLSVMTEEEIPLLLPELFGGDFGLLAATAATTEWDGRSSSREESWSYREQLEKQSIVQALHKTNGSASAAAKLLGIPRSTFYRKLQKYRL